MSASLNLNEYATAEHALKYLARADRIPHRTEGEAILLDFIPSTVSRILDLGTGEDPSNKLVSVEVQLHWLRDIGFTNLDCHWKWLELALSGSTRREGSLP